MLLHSCSCQIFFKYLLCYRLSGERTGRKVPFRIRSRTCTASVQGKLSSSSPKHRMNQQKVYENETQKRQLVRSTGIAGRDTLSPGRPGADIYHRDKRLDDLLPLERNLASQWKQESQETVRQYGVSEGRFSWVISGLQCLTEGPAAPKANRMRS